MMYQPQEQGQGSAHRLNKSVLLQQHPVLVPLILLGGSLLAGLAAIVFPLLTGVPMISFVTLCLSLACVMGIAGLLVGITGILALVDESSRKLQHRPSLFTRLLSKVKEQYYS